MSQASSSGFAAVVESSRRVFQAIDQDIQLGFLAGSHVSGSAGPSSDIDLLVVLEATALPRAHDVRSRFVRLYLAAHRDLSLSADPVFPGELLTPDDLSAVMGGSAFRRTATGHVARVGLDQPFRYWLSMIGNGQCLLGDASTLQLAAWRQMTAYTAYLTARTGADPARLERNVFARSVLKTWGLRGLSSGGRDGFEENWRWLRRCSAEQRRLLYLGEPFQQWIELATQVDVVAKMTTAWFGSFCLGEPPEGVV